MTEKTGKKVRNKKRVKAAKEIENKNGHLTVIVDT